MKRRGSAGDWSRITEHGRPNDASPFAGNLDAVGTGRLWGGFTMRLRAAGGRGLTLDLFKRGSAIDTAGATFLIDIEATSTSGKVETAGRAGPAPRPCSTVSAAPQRPRRRPASPPPLRLRDIGRGALRAAGATGSRSSARRPWRSSACHAGRRMLRAQDLLLYADQAGVRSLPLVVLLGFLIGLILAFQSAVPMRRFGADLYVVNLVAISLLRELGPLLAAVILAGRTGSAFAAEIGTMKVNEEVDALVTMGLDPMTMLVLPRLLAAMLVMPAMTLVLDIAGLLGMTVVMMAFGFPAGHGHQPGGASGAAVAICSRAWSRPSVSARWSPRSAAARASARASGRAPSGWPRPARWSAGSSRPSCSTALFAVLIYRLGL